jgi:hypothetical protein
MQVPVAITTLFWVATSYVLYIIISAFLTSRRNATKARELKCEEPPLERNRLPLGIDNLLRSLAADRAKQFPVDLIRRFEEVGTNTYRYQVLGTCYKALWSLFRPFRTYLDTPLLPVYALIDSYSQQGPGISGPQIQRISRLFSQLNFLTSVSITRRTSPSTRR